jgi:hypothetical protein
VYGGVVRIVVASVMVAAGIGCAPRAGVLVPDHPILGDVSGHGALSVGSEPAVFDDPAPNDDDEAKAARTRIAKVAGEQVGKGPIVVAGARYRMDCSGIASGIYAKAGFVVGGEKSGGLDTRALFQLVKKTGSLRRRSPLPGDLAFFDDTYDANGNGLRDDPLSHVAIVERVDDDGTVILVHRVGASVVRARMNLAQPHLRHDAQGRVLNHYLRMGDASSAARTTAELFVAFGSLPLREASPVVALR